MSSQLEIIEDVDKARAILLKNPQFVVYMNMDFQCWIREGVPDSAGIPVARGPFVARISEPVFDCLRVEMEQAYCSEFYQRRAGH